MAADIVSTDTILEIGPGKGALTERLLEKAGKVVAVEKDRELVAYLHEKFAKEITEKKLVLIEDDILEFKNDAIVGTRYKIVANIPYNITGAIIRKFMETKQQPGEMVLLVQKEVAERIVARDGKESILSLSVKAYGMPKYIAKVPARDFSPAPKVDSAIIAIKNISRDQLQGISEKSFFEVLRAGFAHKRKVLIKNLEAIAARDSINMQFKSLGLSEKIRAEDVPLEKWLSLSSLIK